MKKDVIADLVHARGYTNKEADTMFDDVFASVQTVLNRTLKVTVPRFGTFHKKTRAARTARNPATGATVAVPAKDVVSFKESKSS